MYKTNNPMKNKVIVAVFSLLAMGSTVFAQSPNKHYQQNKTKMEQLLNAINSMYVDSVDFDPLLDKAIDEMLKELDPHTAYIPPKDVQAMTEPLQGSFDGIGVTFQLIKDTINVMEVIIDGPSEKVGLMAGDKIIKVDDTVATGKDISNDWVRKHLRGKKGSKVKVTVMPAARKNPSNLSSPEAPSRCTVSTSASWPTPSPAMSNSNALPPPPPLNSKKPSTASKSRA